MAYLRRQAITSLMVANALYPVNKRLKAGRARWVTGWFGFGLGMLSGELAHQVLAVTAIDTAQTFLRCNGSRKGLALGAVNSAALAFLVRQSDRTRHLADDALSESLGKNYMSQIGGDPQDLEFNVRVRDLLSPLERRASNVEVLRDISYGDDQRNVLDIYRLRDANLANAPVLIQVHGGAWSTGDKREQPVSLMSRMAARGWVCIAISYRLAPKDLLPAQIADVKRAVAWTRAEIAGYGGDPTYIAVAGASAGGHLVSMVALTPEVASFQPGFESADTRVSACVPSYGAFDLAGMDPDGGIVTLRDRLLVPKVMQLDPVEHRNDYERVSPQTHLSERAPDFFVLHGAHDTLVAVQGARNLVRGLRKVSNGIVTSLELPFAHHGYDQVAGIRARHAYRAVERWLEWHRYNRRAATSARQLA